MSPRRAYGQQGLVSAMHLVVAALPGPHGVPQLLADLPHGVLPGMQRLR